MSEDEKCPGCGEVHGNRELTITITLKEIHDGIDSKLEINGQANPKIEISAIAALNSAINQIIPNLSKHLGLGLDEHEEVYNASTEDKVANAH